MDLQTAKELVEGSPKTVKENITEEEAEWAIKKLEEAVPECRAAKRFIADRPRRKTRREDKLRRVDPAIRERTPRPGETPL